MGNFDTWVYDGGHASEMFVRPHELHLSRRHRLGDDISPTSVRRAQREARKYLHVRRRERTRAQRRRADTWTWDRMRFLWTSGCVSRRITRTPHRAGVFAMCSTGPDEQASTDATHREEGGDRWCGRCEKRWARGTARAGGVCAAPRRGPNAKNWLQFSRGYLCWRPVPTCEKSTGCEACRVMV